MIETPVSTVSPPDPLPRSLYDRRMLEALVCPLTHSTLRYDADAQELISVQAHLAFPIRNGIPIMLVDEARQTDQPPHDHVGK